MDWEEMKRLYEPKLVEQWGKLEDLYRAAVDADHEYYDSLSDDSNVISIAPDSPARRRWEARMELIKFTLENQDMISEIKRNLEDYEDYEDYEDDSEE